MLFLLFCMEFIEKFQTNLKEWNFCLSHVNSSTTYEMYLLLNILWFQCVFHKQNNLSSHLCKNAQKIREKTRKIINEKKLNEFEFIISISSTSQKSSQTYKKIEPLFSLKTTSSCKSNI